MIIYFPKAMKDKGIVLAVVGVLIGFILGFFTSQVMVPSSSSQPIQESVENSGELPEGHPTEDLIAQLQELEGFAEANSEDSQSRVALGNAYYDMGRYDVAIQWYEQALVLEPENVSVSTDLGTAYLYSGDAIMAVERYKHSLEIEPEHAQTLQNIAVAHMSAGNSSEALAYFEKLLQIHPEIPQREMIEEQMERIKASM